MRNLRFIIASQLVYFALVPFLCSNVSARNISWSGYNWWVRTSGGNPQGPGPNIFSDSTETVFVDSNGDLHLRIHQENGKWVGAEINNHQSLGYGTYEWEVSSRYDLFATNVVGGLFTYLDPNSVANQTEGLVGNGIADTPHEIDIEFTQAWGGANLYHTTHDPDVQSPSTSYYQALTGDNTTHRFTWTEDSITWGSYHGHVAGVANPLHPIAEQRSGPHNGNPAIHTYTGPVVPKDLNEIPIINFWMSGNNVSNTGPTDGLDQEMIIHRFTFTPLSAAPDPSADFDEDGDVDGRDFLTWQRGFSTGTGHNHGDADYNGVVDAVDLEIWTSQYAGETSLRALTIPEPSSALLLFGTSGFFLRFWSW
jgi:hypothetical protein